VAHHAIADGLGGVELAAEFFDSDRAASVSGPLPPAPEAEHLDEISLNRDALAHVGRRGLAMARGLAAAGGGALARIGRDPVGAGRSGLAYLGSALRLMSPVTATASPVMTGRGEDRRYDVIDLDFEALHRAARAAGATVNDAFLAAISTGLSRYHEAHGAPVDRLRVTMPISTRGALDPSASNRNDAARFALPVGGDDVADRLARIHAVSSAMRREPALAAPGVVAGIVGLLPAWGRVPVMGSFMSHMDLLASNVPGYPEAPYLCGARVDRWFLLGPTEGSALAVTLLSHAGRADVGVTTDTAAVEDPDQLVACLRDGFAAVLELGH
jgi:WS/DGAT/MGAT family acyltransferase